MSPVSHKGLVRILVGLIGLLLLHVSTPLSASNNDSEEFVCFSLAAARRVFNQKMTAVPEEVEKLGFITQPIALVVDPETKDCIVVGKRDPKRPALYLDDLVVALRAIYVYPQAHGPGVSIEPVQSRDREEKHLVRYFGGVEGTRFGRVCFDSDYLLKKIDMGLVPSGSPQVVTSWDSWATSERSGKSAAAFPHFVSFFYPVGSGAVFDSTTVSIGAFRLAVGAISAPSENSAVSANRFIESLNRNFAEVAEAHPVLKDLENLMCLYVLCNGIDSLAVTPKLGFYLERYRTQTYDTPKAVEPLRRGVVGIGYNVEANGDLSITRGQIIRMKLGDPWAIGRVVLASRPDARSIVWVIRLKGSTVAQQTSPTASDQVDLGNFYLQKGEYHRALEAFLNAKQSETGSVDRMCGAALAYLGLGDIQAALTEAQAAVAADSSSSYAWRVHGEVLVRMGTLQKGLESLERANRQAPEDEEIGCTYGDALTRAGQVRAATGVYKRILSSNKRAVCALMGIAHTLRESGNYREAYEYWMSVVKYHSDPVYEQAARDSAITLINEKHVFVSSTSEIFFPSKSRPGSRSMWNCALNFQLDYGFGRDFFDPRAIVLLDRQQLRLALPLQGTYILKNRLRLALTIPMLVQVVPFERAKCFAVGNGNAVCTNSEFTVGTIGGIAGPDLFLSYLWAHDLMDQPLLISHIGVISPTGDPFFEDYFGTREGEMWRGAIPFRSDSWRGKVAFQAELPTSRDFKFDINFSHEQDLTGDTQQITGWAFGGKRGFGAGVKPYYIGAEVSGITSGDQHNIRLAVTLDLRQKEEWQVLSLGAGYSDVKGSARENYFFFSTGMGWKIFKFGGWL
jgi:Tfp pilus assembly protein PilF